VLHRLPTTLPKAGLGHAHLDLCPQLARSADPAPSGAFSDRQSRTRDGSVLSAVRAILGTAQPTSPIIRLGVRHGSAGDRHLSGICFHVEVDRGLAQNSSLVFQPGGNNESGPRPRFYAAPTALALYDSLSSHTCSRRWSGSVAESSLGSATAPLYALTIPTPWRASSPPCASSAPRPRPGHARPHRLRNLDGPQQPRVELRPALDPVGAGALAVTFLIGAIHLSRAAIGAERAVARGADDQARAQLARWAWGYALIIALLVVPTWDMVHKPGP
jgi:hypothetical protein